MKEKTSSYGRTETQRILNQGIKIAIIASLIIMCIVPIIVYILSNNSMWKSYPEEIYERLELMTANEGEKIDDFLALVEGLESKQNVTLKRLIYENSNFKIIYCSTECKDNMETYPTIIITVSNRGEVLSKVRDYASQQEYIKLMRSIIRDRVILSALCSFVCCIILVFVIIFLVLVRQEEDYPMKKANRKK